jgi:hypothetical protein
MWEQLRVTSFRFQDNDLMIRNDNNLVFVPYSTPTLYISQGVKKCPVIVYSVYNVY